MAGISVSVVTGIVVVSMGGTIDVDVDGGDGGVVWVGDVGGVVNGNGGVGTVTVGGGRVITGQWQIFGFVLIEFEEAG